MTSTFRVGVSCALVVTNSGPFNGMAHTVQDRSGNIIAVADGTTGVVAKGYIWRPVAGYAGTDLPVGMVDVAGSATPELLYGHADQVSSGAAGSRRA